MIQETGYYPGCSLHASSKNLDITLKDLFKKLGIKLNEIPDWNCCGASAAHCIDETIALSLPARDLARAEKEGFKTVLAPCSACYQRLVVTHEILVKDPKKMEKVEKLISPNSYKGMIVIKNIMDLLINDVTIPEIVARKEKDLNGLKFVAYYGCWLTRIPRVKSFDSVENPVSIENILKPLGAEPIDWPYKTDCCGGSFSISKEELVIELDDKIISMADKVGAECIVTTCPLCQTNLDVMQEKINKIKGKDFNLPVFYITELLGIALGIKWSSKIWRYHMVDPVDLLKSKRLI